MAVLSAAGCQFLITSLSVLSLRLLGPRNLLSDLASASLISLSWQRPDRLSLFSANSAATQVKSLRELSLGLLGLQEILLS